MIDVPGVVPDAEGEQGQGAKREGLKYRISLQPK
jgi:hypothetical protein